MPPDLDQTSIPLLAYDRWVAAGLMAVFMSLFSILFHFELEHRRTKKARAAVLGLLFLAALFVTVIIVSFIGTS